jgi:site-specific DNA recombinase
MKAALYIRVSTEEQAISGTSPDTQREKLRTWAKLKDFRIVREYEDLGISGKIPLQDRPQGKQLLTDAKEHKFSVLLVYSIDRFGRSALEILKAVELLKDLGIALLSYNESFDGTTLAGGLSLTMLAAIAQFEKAQISERTLSGRDRRARNKKYIGGTVSFGYDIDTEVHLIPSTWLISELGCTEADALRNIFERISSGSTLMAECKRLNEAGVPCLSRYGAGGIVNRHTPWLVSRLSAMLRNEVYIGRYTFNSKRGKIVYDVPPLIDKALWNAAHVQLRKNKYHRESKQRLNLLKGIIRCACRASMSAVPAYTGNPKRY